jgi:hypothetical protein
MSDLEPIRRTLAATLARRDAQARGLADLVGRLAAERARLAAAQAAGDANEIADATAKIWDLGVQRAAAARAIESVHEQARAGLDARLGSILHLEGDTPLALLPVRLEARSTADGASLRVRIFHDALHTESLDEGLSESERDAGLEYWSVVWRDGDPRAPWSALIAAVGRSRAPWVAEALRPRNIAVRPVGEPDFPDTLPRSGRPAVARTLPDRFYVRLEQDGVAPVTVHGAAIPDELPVGLTERDELTALQIAGEDLPPIDTSLRWLVDYAEAERLGMAVTVPLPVPGAAVRRLLVYGVRATLDAAAGAKRMANLIRSHRFTDGAEFVAQGTPTNNTESARTAWSRRTPPGPPELAPGDPLDVGANAVVAARALGLTPELLADLPNARDAEQTRAAAFNRALWATTWADAIEHLTPQGRANGDERLDSPALDAVRKHWIAHVRGRGPVPVVRLGRQPYGLLPLVNTDSAWRPRRAGFVENRLVPFIDQQVRWMWTDGLANVPTIMNRPLDIALPEILGTDAVLRGLRVRTALSSDPLMTTATGLMLPDLGGGAAGSDVTRALFVLSGVADDALDSHDVLAGKTRPLALPLVDDTDLAFIANLLASPPGGMRPKSVLQVLLAHAAAVEEHARDSVAAPNTQGLLRETIAARADIDRDLVFTALESVLGPARTDDRLVAQAAEHVTKQVGRLDLRVVADRHPFAALAPATTLQQLAGTTPESSRLTGDLGLQLVGEVFHRSTRAAEHRGALREIAAITSLEERRLLLSETLDCCSHRLDAWITAAAALRLDDVRSDRPHGLLLGAYGWLENLAVRTPAAAGQVDGRDVLHDGTDGGYVHAPGLTHAATAAVLRSGRLTHRRGDPNSTAMDIDLSSTRVRDALALLDGMRQGQSLGALLGYRLERRLHEASGAGKELDRFIYVLRALAPLRGGKLTEPNAPVQESLAASDVVDGLRLMAIDEAVIRQKLDDGPADPRYIVLPDRWLGPTPGEADAVVAAIADLESTHDAVADLLLAESVHQLVSGNAARSAATLDTLGAGEASPLEPEVVRTPRFGVSIQHRLVILVPDPLATRHTGWNTTAPRARAEPSLEVWAQGALGDPGTLLIAEESDANVAQARLCALDVIYDADGDSVATSTLAARLRAALPDLGADLKPLAPIWELCGLLRTVLLTGRPLTASDLGPSMDATATGRVADAAELLARAHTALDTLRAIATNPTPQALLAGFGIWPAATVPGGAAPSTVVQTLVDQANARVVAAAALLARAVPPAPPKTLIELARQALEKLFGGGFVAVPILAPPPPAETDLWTGALGPGGVRPRPGGDIRPWLARVGGIRNAASAFGETLLVREAFERRPLLRGVQFPASAFATWAALPFPDGRPPMAPLVSVVAEVAGAQAGDPEPALDQALAGVVLDEWTEVVPRRLERRDPANPDDPAELVDVTTTGLAVNANAPGARPPQAILLVLSPDGGDWTGDRLAHALDEALTLAKMRTITLQQLPYAGRQLPALYFRDWSLQGEPVIDWSIVAQEFAVANVQKFLSVDD